MLSEPPPTPTAPAVFPLSPCCQDSTSNKTIGCLVTGYFPEPATVQWNSGNITSGIQNFPAVQQPSSGTYTFASQLTVAPSSLSFQTFECNVEHVATNTRINKEIKDCCKPIPPPCWDAVHVETIPPSFADIFLTKSAKLTCRISNVPSEQDLEELNVTWIKASDNKELETVIGQPKTQENSELLFVEATASVCKEEWDSEDTFECKVTLPLLPTAVIKILKKVHGGTPRAPSVYVFPPPSEQLVLQETATITCLAKGFYPNDLFVTWLRNDEPVGDSESFTSCPVQESKTPKQYFSYSTLNVNEQDWRSGDSYTCVVVHEALPLQTIQKTVDKNTGKPTLVNVSLVLSDTATTCH